MSHIVAVVVASVISAVVATGLNYLYNRKLAASNRSWERKNSVLRTTEELCDELIRDVAVYWSTSANDGASRLQPLEGKIRAYTLFLSRLVMERFGENNEVEDALLEVVDVVTGGTFESKDHAPDREYINVAVNAIVDLRFAVSKAIKNAPDNGYS